MNSFVFRIFNAGFDKLASWLLVSPAPDQTIQTMKWIRFGIGMTLVVWYLNAWTQANSLFGSSGYFYGFLPAERIPLEHGLAGVWVGLLILFALCFALGKLPILCGGFSLMIHSQLHSTAPWAFWGWGLFIKAMLLYLILFELLRIKSTHPFIQAPLRFIQIHVAAQYMAASWSRLDQPKWVEGRMLYEALWNEKFTRWDFDFTPWQGTLEFFCKMALTLEVLAPIALFLPWIGPLWAIALVGLHLILELTVTVGGWQMMMISALIGFILPEYFKLKKISWIKKSVSKNQVAAPPPL